MQPIRTSSSLASRATPARSSPTSSRTCSPRRLPRFALPPADIRAGAPLTAPLRRRPRDLRIRGNARGNLPAEPLPRQTRRNRFRVPLPPALRRNAQARARGNGRRRRSAAPRTRISLVRGARGRRAGGHACDREQGRRSGEHARDARLRHIDLRRSRRDGESLARGAVVAGRRSRPATRDHTRARCRDERAGARRDRALARASPAAGEDDRPARKRDLVAPLCGRDDQVAVPDAGSRRGRARRAVRARTRARRKPVAVRGTRAARPGAVPPGPLRGGESPACRGACAPGARRLASTSVGHGVPGAHRARRRRRRLSGAARARRPRARRWRTATRRTSLPRTRISRSDGL